MGALDHVELRLVQDMQDILDFESWFTTGPLQHGVMGIDTETTGLSQEKDRVRVGQLGDENAGWVFPCEGYGALTGVFTQAITRFNGTMALHNAPFDWGMISKLGIKLDRGRIEDTMVMSHIREPHLPKALKPQVTRHVDKTAMSAQQDLEEAIAKFGWDGINIYFPPYWIYAALDPILTVLLRKFHREHVVDLPAWEVENAVIWPLHDMERHGARVDKAYAAENLHKFREYCRAMQDWAKSEYGISLSKDAQLLGTLEDMGFEFTKLTKSGAVSLDKEVLEPIDHPLAQTALKYRTISKLASTYLRVYAEEIDEDFLLHPSINALGARTSRMSMSEPNMQNLPRVSERVPAATVIRNCIVSRPGHTLIMCDFDQIEMRGLAHMSGDEGLVQAFHEDIDFFVSLARSVFQDPDIDSKKDARRQLVKSVGYGKIYGAGVEKLAKTARIPYSQAQQATDAFDKAFPGVKVFVNATIAEAHQNRRDTGKAFVTCPLTGRKHYCDPGHEYALVNYKIQGWAAYLFKTKILELANTEIGQYMILPVHDEIILDVPDELVPRAVQILEEVMSDHTSFLVPITAGVSWGQRWGEKEDYK